MYSSEKVVPSASGPASHSSMALSNIATASFKLCCTSTTVAVFDQDSPDPSRRQFPKTLHKAAAARIFREPCCDPDVPSGCDRRSCRIAVLICSCICKISGAALMIPVSVRGSMVRSRRRAKHASRLEGLPVLRFAVPALACSQDQPPPRLARLPGCATRGIATHRHPRHGRHSAPNRRRRGCAQ